MRLRSITNILYMIRDYDQIHLDSDEHEVVIHMLNHEHEQDYQWMM